MKLSQLFAFVFMALVATAADVTDLAMQDGSHIKGKVMSVSASEATVMTDFGILRIALEKFSAETKTKITADSKPDTAALLARIAELEAKISQLQQENEALRRQSVSAPVTGSTFRPNSFAPSSSNTPGRTLEPSTGTSSTLSHTISSTGKRHNSSCRYFGSGRACSAADGIACKICGG